MTFSDFKRFISTRLGRCPKCFRASLLGAVIGWAAMPPAYSLLPQPESWIVFLWPLSFTALWVLHMLIFAQRALSTGREVTLATAAPELDRRRALAIFGAALLVAVLASMPRRASAGQACVNGYHVCADNRHCCPDGYNYACIYDQCTGRRTVFQGRVGRRLQASCTMLPRNVFVLEIVRPTPLRSRWRCVTASSRGAVSAHQSRRVGTALRVPRVAGLHRRGRCADSAAAESATTKN
jgi:hypothetical protein